jgi:hypothetical protein
LKVETAEKFLNKFDELARWAGAMDFEDGMQQLKRLLVAFLQGTERVQTKEEFRKLLSEMPEPSFAEQKLFLGSMQFLPHLLRYGIKKLSDAMEKELPSPPTGRPRIEFQTRAEIVAFIGDLHTRGTSLEVAKKRAAQHFGYGPATVERMWIERGQISEVDFRSALKWFSDASESS